MANDWRLIVHKNKLPSLAERAKPFARTLVAKSAYEIEGRAKVKAPVDTGNLRNSINTDIVNNGLTGIIHAAAEYAAYVEFGTKRMSAQPYMLPAFREVEPEFIKAWSELASRF